ncbi:MAG: THUMP domain-containing class I SAM-dependent RNA methyltransferase, partial [Burkholderiales bacterium]
MSEHFFATCPRGLEQALADELVPLQAGNVATVAGGTKFEGEYPLCYRVNLHSRIASRVLWRIAQGDYRSEQDIYKACLALPWPDWFSVDKSLMVKVSAQHCSLKSLNFVTLRIKDAVCDRFRNATGRRPSVDTGSPQVRIYAFLEENLYELYIDTSGPALFQRGYRKSSVPAPLRENLAAGIIKLSGWSPDQPFFDPMCGGATLLIEAA